MPVDGKLQVLLPAPSEPALIAGLPSVFRTAQRAAEELAPGRLVFASPDPGFGARWSRQLASFEDSPAACGQSAEGAVLVVAADAVPAPGALKRFLASGRSRLTRGGRTLAVYFPSANGTAAELLARPAEAVESGEGWFEPSDPRAEKALYASLGKDTDGFIARFDRRLSTAVSRLLLRTPVTPNQITTASLALGLLGSWWLASGAYWTQVAGALLLWSCCILDGCDGEVARLKLLCSKSGATYDVAADNFAHLATFAAIPVGVHRANPELSFLVPGALLVSGVAACMFSVWWLVLRRPPEERGRFELLIERVASRDYVYLIVLLALLGRLEWFLWAAGVGSHAFNAALWALARKKT